MFTKIGTNDYIPDTCATVQNFVSLINIGANCSMCFALKGTGISFAVGQWRWPVEMGYAAGMKSSFSFLRCSVCSLYSQWQAGV